MHPAARGATRDRRDLSAPLPESALTAAAERTAQEPQHPAAGARNGSAERTPAVKGVPTPKDLAALRGPGVQHPPQPASATLRWSSDKGWVDRPVAEPAEAASMPTLAQLTTAEQRWADREEDITTVGGDPFEVGQVIARRRVERYGTGRPPERIRADLRTKGSSTT
ncbi:hypothetical protein SGRIM128S_03492 [Streptomyces griseomycini]